MIYLFTIMYEPISLSTLFCCRAFSSPTQTTLFYVPTQSCLHNTHISLCGEEEGGQ